MAIKENGGLVLQKKVAESDIVLAQMLADECSPKEIAAKLKISHRTVEKRIYTLKNAYGCRGRAGLLVLFFRNGLIK
jgi:DNA-binding CsgD family transcriptional regulator